MDCRHHRRGRGGRSRRPFRATQMSRLSRMMQWSLSVEGHIHEMTRHMLPARSTSILPLSSRHAPPRRLHFSQLHLRQQLRRQQGALLLLPESG